MPLISGTGYHPGWLFRNAHASTVIPSTLRKVPAVSYVRQRLELPDGDFLDVDWSRCGAKRAVVLWLVGGRGKNVHLDVINEAEREFDANNRGTEALAAKLLLQIDEEIGFSEIDGFVTSPDASLRQAIVSLLWQYEPLLKRASATRLVQFLGAQREPEQVPFPVVTAGH